MYIKKHHLIKKSIVLASFFVCIIASTFAAVTYDSTIQSRAATLLSTIKANAQKISPLDTSSYYSLLRLNIKSLMQVLTLVDEGIVSEQAKIPWLTDSDILNILDTTGTSTTWQQECKFSLKPYFDLGFKTTFYANNGKIYEPTSLGDMILPGDMMSDFYVWKDTWSNPQYYFRCKDWMLTVSDKNLQITTPLPGVIAWQVTPTPVSTTPIVVNNTRAQELFQQKFENCYTEYRIASCEEFMWGSPGAFSRYTSPGNTACNGNSKADANGWTMNYFEEKISNSDVVLRWWGCSVMSQGGYCRKGTTIEVSPETVKKEIGITEAVGSEWWWAGRNSWYTDKFTPAPLTDSCYTKTNEKMYHKEYFSQAFEPKIETVRVNDEKWQWMEWTTQSVEKLSWSCKDWYGSKRQSNDNEKLNREKYFSTWEDLHKNNWPTGVYQCRWTLVWNGKTRYKDETVIIK